ncbi:hypothetical protein [Gordonia otitidis]|nr:hypothetical protein [Gordonia otitidis]
MGVTLSEQVRSTGEWTLGGGDRFDVTGSLWCEVAERSRIAGV